MNDNFKCIYKILKALEKQWTFLNLNCPKSITKNLE